MLPHDTDDSARPFRTTYLDRDAQQMILADSTLKHNDRMVFDHILTYATWQGDLEASVSEIGELTKLKPGTARLVLRRLRAHGDITVKRQGRGRQRTIWHVAAVTSVGG